MRNSSGKKLIQGRALNAGAKSYRFTLVGSKLCFQIDVVFPLILTQILDPHCSHLENKVSKDITGLKCVRANETDATHKMKEQMVNLFCHSPLERCNRHLKGTAVAEKS